MTQVFTLSRNDLNSFQKEVAKLVRKMIPRGWSFLLQIAVWLFVGLAVSTFLRLYENAFEYRRSLALVGGFVLLAVVVFFLAQAAAARLVQKHVLPDNGFLLSPQTLTLDQEGLSLVTLKGMGYSKFAWGAFIGRTDDESNVYLFLDRSYGVIIPKAALAGSNEQLVWGKVNEL